MALDITIGGAASDSYSTLVEWHTYVSDFLDDDVSAHGHDGSHEANLRRAAAYLDRNYIWKGYKVTSTQSMQWPRSISEYVDGFAIGIDEVPTAIKQAQSELAYLIHEGTDIFATVINGAIKKTSVKAAAVQTSTEYSGAREQASFTAIEGMLAPYIESKRSSGGLNSSPIVRG